MSGYLVKAPMSFKNPTTSSIKAWKRRYFVLRRNMVLEYYKDEQAYREGLVPKGTIDLSGAGNVESVPGQHRYSHLFQIQTHNDSIFLSAPGKDEMVQWMAAIKPSHVIPSTAARASTVPPSFDPNHGHDPHFASSARPPVLSSGPSIRSSPGSSHALLSATSAYPAQAPPAYPSPPVAAFPQRQGYPTPQHSAYPSPAHHHQQQQQQHHQQHQGPSLHAYPPPAAQQAAYPGPSARGGSSHHRAAAFAPAPEPTFASASGSSASLRRQPSAFDTAEESQDHMSKAWYYGRCSREEAERELLASARDFDGGLFIVREGSTPGTFALSWCHEKKVSHTLIVSSYGQYRFDVTTGSLLHLRGTSLTDLIESRAFKDVLTRVEVAAKRRRLALAKQSRSSSAAAPSFPPPAAAASRSYHSSASSASASSSPLKMTGMADALPVGGSGGGGRVAVQQEELYTFQTPRNIRAPFFVPADEVDVDDLSDDFDESLAEADLPAVVSPRLPPRRA